MIAGVDGCRGGWVVALGDGWQSAHQPRIMVCSSFTEVLEATSRCLAVAIDIPIGLPTGTQENAGIGEAPWPRPDTWPRLCDRLAREALGAAGKSRLFLAPPRETLVAKDPVEFQSLHLRATGVKASLPVWGIVPKIREVDEGMNPDMQDRVFEFYPELVWKDLKRTELQGGASPSKKIPSKNMGEYPAFLEHRRERALPSKHTREGIAERLDILKKAGLAIDIQWLTIRTNLRHTSVKLDDLLDAVAGLKAAKDFLDQRGSPSSIRSASIPRLPPTEPPKDSKGLRMEIWY